MPSSTHQRLERFLRHQTGNTRTLGTRRIGLEKESLRTAADGKIAATPHPPALGSALTHPWITTDYSEALLEFVTPPHHDAAETLAWLDDIQRFVYANIGDELLWATSMPCVVAGETSIPIAVYGNSNAGMMRHIYRRGLGHRYGRVMQVIAGVHLNFSLGEAFWQSFRRSENSADALGDFRSASYMGLIRNQQRLGWVVPYLFGCSPAVCNSFLRSTNNTGSGLVTWDDHTSYGPHATSLRMSDIGYQNKKKAGLRVSYDSLEDYVSSLEYAIRTPWPAYEQIGVVVDGEYRQLNANILQIENEYYSSIRPKPPGGSDETPATGLRRHGIEYVELRSLDINAFDPLGISEQQIRFLEAFLLYCLFSDSPVINATEAQEIEYNQSTATCRGREPGLQLRRHGTEVSLRAWASELFTQLAPFCAALDADRDEPLYTMALEALRPLVDNPELTPSARMLAQVRDQQQSFFALAMESSRDYQRRYLERPLPAGRAEQFRQWATQSLAEQARIEASDSVDFASYLDRRITASA